MDKTTFTMFVDRHRVLMHMLFFISVFLIPVAAAIFAAEITVQVHLFVTGETRSAQSENYLLVFQALIFGVASALITLPAMIFCWWATMKK
jgi:hypothetical protein